MNYFSHESTYIDPTAQIGSDSKIWHFCHIDSKAKIGENCSLGQNVYVGKQVEIGNGVKIQNNVSVYSGVILEDYVFCGPSVVFTNDLNPRSEYPKQGQYESTLIKKGASLGANSTIICGNTIGQYALIGAGSVITKNIPDYSIQVGNPSKHVGWICQCGKRLKSDLKCDNCTRTYKKIKDSIKQV